MGVLTDLEKKVLILRYQEGLSKPGIAKKLGWKSVGSVDNVIKRVNKKLKDIDEDIRFIKDLKGEK